MSAGAMTAGSLFSGVGGFDLALERDGFEVLWQVEYDAQARSVLRRHWPGVSLHEDVRNVGAAQLARVDLICGGFPCQDLSVAGRRAGLAGERSGLFHEFMRIVAELAPAWVLIENVPGLLSSNGGRDMGTVLGTLGKLGYGYAYRVLDSRFFGVAQRRRRVFIVGRAGGVCPPEVLFEPESLRGDPAPGSQAGQDVAGTLGGRAAGEGGFRFDLDNNGAYPLVGGDGSGVAGAVSARWVKGTGGPSGDECQNLVLAEPTPTSVVALSGEAVGPLDASYGKGPGSRAGVEREFVVVNAEHGLAPHGSMEPSDTVPVLSGSEFKGHTFAFKPSHYTRGKDGAPAEVTPPLSADADKGDQDAVVLVSETGKGFWSEGCSALRADPGGMPSHIAYAIGSHAGAADADASNRSHASGGPVGANVSEETAYSLRADRTQGVVAFNCKQSAGEPGADIAPTLQAMPHDASHPNGGGQVAVAFQERGRPEGRAVEWSDDDTAYALTAPKGGARTQEKCILPPAAIPRRLTPTECERLQAFPDGHTAYGVDENGKRVELADGPRYRCMGNAVTTTVVEWIARRVAAAHGAA